MYFAAWSVRNTSRCCIYRMFALQPCRFQSNHSLQEYLSNVKEVQFAPYFLKRCTLGTSFSDANVKPVECVADEKGNLRDPECISEIEMRNYTSYRVYFKDLFAEGFHMLHDSESTRRIYEISPLVNFLKHKEYHERCLRKALHVYRDGKIFKESHFSIMLAIHLFSQLIFPSYDTNLTDTTMPLPYIVSNDVPDKVVICPCGCGRSVFYGNTAFGTTALWYGSPDILPFSNGGICSISLPPVNAIDILEKNEVAEGGKHLLECKNDRLLLRQLKSIRQFAAQAITFSYYQASIQEGNKDLGIVSLIPTIAISKRGFDLYMYDSVHEIFLRNCVDPLPLWNEEYVDKHNGTINISSIVILWMLINHLRLKPKFSSKQISMFGGSCRLAVGREQLEEIKRTITFSKHFQNLDIQKKIDQTMKKTV